MIVVRATLHDDPHPVPGRPAALGLDDDLLPVTWVALSDDPGVRPVVTVNPTVSVKDRVSDGYDEEGNQQWTWVDRVLDAPTIQWTQRTVKDPRGGITLVKATVTFLYPPSMPDIRETASAKTSDGNVWSVRSVERYPTQTTLSMERVDDGD